MLDFTVNSCESHKYMYFWLTKLVNQFELATSNSSFLYLNRLKKEEIYPF